MTSLGGDPLRSLAPRQAVPIVVLQCSNCLAIVSDTMEYYVASDGTQRTITVSDARLITVDGRQVVSQSGWDQGCVFQLMTCSTCEAQLGRVYFATSQRLAHLCNNYTFSTDSLVSYQLGSIEQAAKAAAESLARGARQSGGAPGPETQSPPGGAGISRAAAEREDRAVTVPVKQKRIDDGETVRGGDSNTPAALAQAVAELDEHVDKLTVASNQSTAAHKRIFAEVSDVRQEGELQREKLNIVEESVDKVQNLMLTWGDRMGQFEKRLRAAEAQSIARGTLEARFAALEERLLRAAETYGASPSSPFVGGNRLGAVQASNPTDRTNEAANGGSRAAAAAECVTRTSPLANTRVPDVSAEVDIDGGSGPHDPKPGTSNGPASASRPSSGQAGGFGTTASESAVKLGLVKSRRKRPRIPR
jgi:hypothetical protein